MKKKLNANGKSLAKFGYCRRPRVINSHTARAPLSLAGLVSGGREVKRERTPHLLLISVKSWTRKIIIPQLSIERPSSRIPHNLLL